MAKIYHNPRCGKSRQTLSLLQERTSEVKIIEYLKTPPTKEELRSIVKKLNIEPEALIRKGEAIFKENFKGKDLTDDEWVNVMVENPKLIERPIVINNGKAAIGRPPEKVIEIL